MTLLLTFPLLDGDDYSSRILSFSFRTNSVINETGCIDIFIQSDSKFETNESFSVGLSTSSPELIAFLPQKTTVTIIDDDSE